MIYDQVGRGMTMIPVKSVPDALRKRLVPHVENVEVANLFVKQRRSGTLYFSGLYRIPSWGCYAVGNISRLLTPVRLAAVCGWILPLRANTPLYMVTDYLIEEGQEDTKMVRLMKLILAR